MSQWRPIKFYSSGKAMLMWDGALMFIGWFNWRSATWGPDPGRVPTHYMPLPKPPEAA